MFKVMDQILKGELDKHDSDCYSNTPSLKCPILSNNADRQQQDYYLLCLDFFSFSIFFYKSEYW